MRAVELRIVFEDDDGGTYVFNAEGEQAQELISRAFPDLGWGGRYEEKEDLARDGTVVGPVLRKVTEVEGHVEDWPGDEAYISGTSKRPAMLSSVIPDEARKDCTTYRFRFDVTAVRVPDPERDARELCGLPEKKP